MERFKKYGYEAALLLLLILTGFLTFYGVGSEGYSNAYYSAAVKSMMTSWHDFFFASFDPGGFVTVDKPALGLWLQVLSAEIFGYHGWSLILPEALSAVISTAMVYHIAKRSFGKPAGILSAFIFSLTPVLIAVSRTNNLDSSLVMVLLIAAWVLITAAEKGSMKRLILAAALVGIGFNIKMLEAFMVLPAFYAAYWLAPGLKTRQKIAHLATATTVLLVISLSWSVAVDLTPADQRPYVGSSQTNSELNLAIGYNGIERITGMDGGNLPGNHAGAGGFPDGGGFSGQMPDARNPGGNGGNPGIGGGGPGDGQPQINGDGQPQVNGGENGIDGGNSHSFGGNPSEDWRQRGNSAPGRMVGGPGSESENGPKGLLRIFNRQLAGQIGWFLPMAFFGAFILSFKMRDRSNPRRVDSKLHFWLWSVWLLSMLAYFSFAGFFHRYYLSMMAPAIALLSGIGLVEMWRAYRGRDWKWLVLPASILATAALQGIILSRYPEWGNILSPIVITAGILSCLVLVIIRLTNKDNLVRTMGAALGAGILALLAAPAAWSVTPILYGSEATLPYAGPELHRPNTAGGFVPGFNGAMGSFFRQLDGGLSENMVTFLLEHKGNDKFLVAVSSATEAAPVIIETGEPVMAMGGFTGSDNILTVEELKNKVAAGEVRYFLIRGAAIMGSQGEITRWILQNGVPVEGMQGLYDLSGVSGNEAGKTS